MSLTFVFISCNTDHRCLLEWQSVPVLAGWGIEMATRQAAVDLHLHALSAPALVLPLERFHFDPDVLEHGTHAPALHPTDAHVAVDFGALRWPDVELHEAHEDTVSDTGNGRPARTGASRAREGRHSVRAHPQILELFLDPLCDDLPAQLTHRQVHVPVEYRHV